LEKESDKESQSDTLGQIAEGHERSTFRSEVLEKESDKESQSDTLGQIAEGHERHTFRSEVLEKESDKESQTDTLGQIAEGLDLHTFGSDELEKQSDEKSDTLGQIAEGHERHTFRSEELEKLTYQVMVLFDDLQPASLVQALALDVIALSNTPRLGLPLSDLLIAGMSEPTIARNPIRNSVMLSSGETIQMRVPYRGWANLLNSYRFATGEDLVAAWRALPSRDSHEGKKRVQPQTRYRRPDNVGQSDESVIRWFNRRHHLSDFGIDVSGNVGGCPLCDGQMLLWWDVDRACHCAWCSCSRQLLTPFEMRRIRDGISDADLAAKIRNAHHLGGVGEVRVVGQAPELARKLEEHLANVERLRNAQLEQMRVVEKGKAEVHIFKGTPGIGKSYAAVMVQAEWLQMGERTGITTATRQQSEAWYADSVKRNSPIKIYQTLAELCDCHPSAKKNAALGKGWRLKHAGSCAYVRQAGEVTNNQDKRNWLFRHNHLAIKNGQLLTPFMNTISDESIVDALLPQDSADVMSDVLRLLKIMEQRNEPIECQQLLRTLFHVANEAELARYSDMKGTELLDLLREKLGKLFEVSLEDAIGAVRKTSHCTAHILIGNNKEQTTNDQPLADDYSNLRKVWLPNLLNALEHDLRNPINPLLALVQKAKKKGENKLAYDWHKKLPFLPNQRDGRHFILDASADPKVYERLLSPWRIRFHLTDVPLSPAVQLFQIKGLNLTKKELERNLPNLVAKVAYLANQHRWQFETLITHKEHEDAIADMLQIHTTLHYRNQRGSNSMKGSKCHLVFGNPNVPTSAILRKAHALRSDTHQPIERYKNGAYFRRGRNGMWVAKDKWLRAVAEMMQLEELIQAIHRARAILITEGQIIVYVGDYNLSACGLNPFVLDASQLHANRKAVQQALPSYRDRVANHNQP
ncbi:MAG: hypothetical protein ACPGWR_11240, partial [Ardenticatenaceae bacterium]